VGFNSLLVQADSDLADVAIHTGFPTRLVIARRTLRAQAVADRLWREELGMFASRCGDAWGGPSAAGLLPLWAGAAPRPKAREMVARHLGPGLGFWSRHPLSTVPFDSPGYCPGRAAGGALSPLLDWLMIRGLYRYGSEDQAGRLNDTMLALAQEKGIWEAYDSETGEGVGAHGSPVTAALVMDLIKTPYHYDRW
jgi:hypothetical protein